MRACCRTSLGAAVAVLGTMAPSLEAGCEAAARLRPVKRRTGGAGASCSALQLQDACGCSCSPRGGRSHISGRCHHHLSRAALVAGRSRPVRHLMPVSQESEALLQGFCSLQ